jgi:hypothetical protein
VIGLCGNSGRSPEPHLHFQVQATPYIGSKTLAYPIALFTEGTEEKLRSYHVPQEGTLVSNPEISSLMSRFFFVQPGRRFEWKISYAGGKQSNEKWEALTDAYNYTCLRVENSDALAYFISSREEWMFTSFQGSQDTFLYEFYRALYRLFMTFRKGRMIEDEFPMESNWRNPLSFLQDFFAPFYRFSSMDYSLKMETSDDPFHPSLIRLSSKVSRRWLNIRKNERHAEIELHASGLIRVSIFHQQQLYCQAECIID